MGKFHARGNILEGNDLAAYAKKKGLCPKCGETQTQERKGRFLNKYWAPREEVKHKNGALLVYKGHCLQPTCFTLRQAKEELGEQIDHSSGLNAQHNSDDDPITGQRLDLARLPNAHHTVQTSWSDEQMEGFIGDESSSSLPLGNLSAGTNRYRRSSDRHRGSSLHLETLVRSQGASILRDIEANGKRNSNTSIADSTSRRIEAGHSASRSYGSSVPDCTTTGSGISSGGGRTHRDEWQEMGASRQSQVTLDMKEAASCLDFIELIRLMECNPSNREAVKEGFRLLCRYVREECEKPDGMICVFASDGWVKSLDMVLMDNETDEDIQVLGVSLYAFLSQVSRGYMLDIVRQGGVKRVLATLNTCRQDEGTINRVTVDNCFCALFCMTDGTVRAGEEISRQTGLTVHHTSADKVVESIMHFFVFASESGKDCALSCLFNLSLQDLQSRAGRTVSQLIQGTVQGQGINTLVDAMESRASNAGASLPGLRLLNQLCIKLKDGESNTIIASVELLILVLSMISNSNREAVHEAAFALLGNMNVNPQAMSTLILVRLAKSISSLMAANRENSALQNAAMASVSRVFRPSQQRDEVLEWDALVSAIVEGMKAHEQNEELQCNGCLSLSTIASSNDSCKLAIVDKGGVAALSAAIKFYTLNLNQSSLIVNDLRLYACAVLSSLASCLRTQSALSGEDMMAPFMEVMKSSSNELPASVRASMATVMISSVQIEGQQGRLAAGFATESLLASRTCEETEMMMVPVVYLCKGSLIGMTILMTTRGGKGISHMLQLMSKYMKSQAIQEAGCEILAELFLQFPFHGHLGLLVPVQVGSAVFSIVPHSEEELIYIKKVIGVHELEGPLVAKAFATMSIFLAGLALQDSATIIVDISVKQLFSGSLKRCVHALLNHQENFKVQLNCLGFIRYLLLLDDTTELSRWSPALMKHILTSLQVHSKGTQLKIGACSTLLAIFGAEKDEKALESIDGRKFASLMLKCISSDSEELAEVASELVASVLPLQVSLVSHFVDLPDSMKTIIKCLVRFQNKAAIVSSCCSILVSVTTLHDSCVLPLIINSGAFSVILDAIDNHQQNEIVQESACKALLGVLRGITPHMLNETRVNLSNTLVQALPQNVTNPEAAAAILEILWYLCSRDAFFKETFSQRQLIPCIVEVMNENLYDRSVQCGGCTSLWSLSSHGDNKRVTGDCGGLKAIINALLAHVDAIRIQKEGLAALKNLATTSRNKQLIIAYRGEDAIVISLKVNMVRSEEVITAAFSALNNIAVDTATQFVASAPAEIFIFILIAMRRYKGSESIQRNACFLLKSYSFASGNVSLMQYYRGEFLPVLSFAAENFPKACGARADYVSSKLYE